MSRSVEIHVQVRGADEIYRKLTELPPKFSKKVMRQALRAAVKPWLQEMQTTAHKFTGWMASQFTIRTSVRGDELEGTAKVAIRNRPNPARAGHEKHVPGAGNELLWNEFGTVNMAAQPVMRPAYESKKETVLSTFTARLQELLAETFQ
jgi:HK97 gp10 family phage protein